METRTRAMINVGGADYEVEAIIEALSPHLLPERIARMSEVLDRRLASVALGVEDLALTHNGAACIRTAEGLGLQDVVAVEPQRPYPLPAETPEAVTKAAQRWVDLHRLKDASALRAWAEARGMRIFGAGPRATMTLEALPVDQPALLLFGNEKNGLLPSTLTSCDDTFRIPMYGFTESYNVSVSVGMGLSAVVARRRAALAAAGVEGDLSPARRRLLLARWAFQSVRAADQILARKLSGLTPPPKAPR